MMSSPQAQSAFPALARQTVRRWFAFQRRYAPARHPPASRALVPVEIPPDGESLPGVADERSLTRHRRERQILARRPAQCLPAAPLPVPTIPPAPTLHASPPLHLVQSLPYQASAEE